MAASSKFVTDAVNRGYYMAARRYEISLRMLKNIYYIDTNEIPNHFILIVFWCERRDLLCSHSKGDIFTCEDNMLFSHVKISSFCAKAHLVFHWCLYNKMLYSCLRGWIRESNTAKISRG